VVSDYERLRQIGKGAYGEVFMARCKTTNKVVALKKLLMVSPQRDGFPIYSIREITLLKRVQHENIVNLVEIVTNKVQRGGSSEDNADADNSIYMVFEYLEYDLQGLLGAAKCDASVKITQAHVRSWAKQLLEGVSYMHHLNILHRDLKGSNILVGRNNQLKIADWGLARASSETVAKYTPNLITLGFRPLELLLGQAKYGASADIWSVGCILGELMQRRPLFPVSAQNSEAQQIDQIFSLCGSPKLSEGAKGLAADPTYRYDLWPTIKEDCPEWHLHAAAEPKPRRLQEAFGGNAHEARGSRPLRAHLGTSVHALDLLEKTLALDPKRRITAKDALDHDYFWKDGEVKRPEQLPKFVMQSAHDMEARNKEREAREKLMAQRAKQASANGVQTAPNGTASTGADGGVNA